MPFIRRVARSRAASVFDLVAGFSYSQILLAAVEAGALELLADGPHDLETIACKCRLSEAAASRLIHAMTALNLAEKVAPGGWMLGQQGAVIQADRGLQAMIRHHRLLYADLTDPLALLRQDRSEPTSLSEFWTYAGTSARPDRDVAAYSELMAVSHAMVAREVLAAYDFSHHRSVLDVGGGHGAFAIALGERHAHLDIALFDLPEVSASAEQRLHHAGLADRSTVHAGDFFRQPLPPGYDCITLNRILHDHDDEPVRQLLSAVRAALPSGGRLVIAEPMADTAGAKAMGAYFDLYLWAMGSGRPRSISELGDLLTGAGFRSWSNVPTRQPLITTMIVALL